MAAHVYYRQENQRHRGALLTACTKDEALRLVDMLCKARNLASIKVIFHAPTVRLGKKTNSSSWYLAANPWRRKNPEEHISLSENMLNLLTVAHEFAHYEHHQLHKERRRQYDIKWHKHPEGHYNPPRASWHNKEHADMTTAALALITAQLTKEGRFKVVVPHKVPTGAMTTKASSLKDTWFQELLLTLLAGRSPEGMSKEERKALDAQLLRDLVTRMPQEMHCPHCDKTLPKEAFGARIMKRNPQGLPMVIQRQSYCRPCRRTPAADCDQKAEVA